MSLHYLVEHKIWISVIKGFFSNFVDRKKVAKTNQQIFNYLHWRPSLCFAVLFLLQNRFRPSYCQISTNLDKNFAHTYCCTEYTCEPTYVLRPRSARRRLPAKPGTIYIYIYIYITVQSHTVSRKKVTPCIHCHNSNKQRQILTEFWTNNAMSNCKQIMKFK